MGGSVPAGRHRRRRRRPRRERSAPPAKGSAGKQRPALPAPPPPPRCRRRRLGRSAARRRRRRRQRRRRRAPRLLPPRAMRRGVQDLRKRGRGWRKQAAGQARGLRPPATLLPAAAAPAATLGVTVGGTSLLIAVPDSPQRACREARGGGGESGRALLLHSPLLSRAAQRTMYCSRATSNHRALVCTQRGPSRSRRCCLHCNVHIQRRGVATEGRGAHGALKVDDGVGHL